MDGLRRRFKTSRGTNFDESNNSNERQSSAKATTKIIFIDLTGRRSRTDKDKEGEGNCVLETTKRFYQISDETPDTGRSCIRVRRVGCVPYMVQRIFVQTKILVDEEFWNLHPDRVRPVGISFLSVAGQTHRRFWETDTGLRSNEEERQRQQRQQGR